MTQPITRDLQSPQFPPVVPGPMQDGKGARVPRKTRKTRRAKVRAQRAAAPAMHPEGGTPLAAPSPLLPAKPPLLVDKLIHVKEDRHSRKHHSRSTVRAVVKKDLRRSRRKFDSTLGYPGEGPGVLKSGKAPPVFSFCKAEPVSCLRQHFHPASKKAKDAAARRKAEADRKMKRFVICKQPGCTLPHHHIQRTGIVHRSTVSDYFSSAFTSHDDPTLVGEKVTLSEQKSSDEHKSHGLDGAMGEDSHPSNVYYFPTPEPQWDQFVAAHVARTDDEEEKVVPAPLPPAAPPAPPAVPSSTPCKVPAVVESKEVEEKKPPKPLPKTPEIAATTTLDPPAPPPSLIDESTDEEEEELEEVSPLASASPDNVQYLPIFVNTGSTMPDRVKKISSLSARLRFRFLGWLLGTYTTSIENSGENPSDTAVFTPIRQQRTLPLFAALREHFTGVRPTGYSEPAEEHIFNQFQAVYTHCYRGQVFIDLIEPVLAHVDFAGMRVLTRSGEMNARLPNFVEILLPRLLGTAYPLFQAHSSIMANTINFCVNRLYYQKRLIYLSGAGVHVRAPLNTLPPSSKACPRNGV